MLSGAQQSPCPRNHITHHVIKDIADKLRPHLIRLNECPTDKCGDAALYIEIIAEIETVKKQITNHDCLCAIHNAINHLEKAAELSKSAGLNEEVLWHLQEVMAFLFKVQNLPT
ncbi:MAG: hypothetical protein FJZ57_04950 [Chlamydiae bacterium]|nr:hypothetical protein [Chlamydiota bacterium]